MANNIVVLGGGESGIGAALLAKQRGYEVFVSDKSALGAGFKAELDQAGIDYEEGQHTPSVLLKASLVIKSPGIADNVPLVVDLKNAGIPVISEIEFASWFCLGKTIGITGSNGKTTTTLLTQHLLLHGGIDSVAGGNVGISFARLLTEQPHAWYVLELSSFQLDGIEQYRPGIAAITSISPDHLDRYNGSMALYTASKFRIVRNQQSDDSFLYNADNEIILSYMSRMPRKPARAFGVSSADTDNGVMHVMGHQFDLTGSSLRGPHNMINAGIAIRAALLAGANAAGIQMGLNTFRNAPHRLEEVANSGDVVWINDSKATNVDALFWALQAMSRPTVLILGGVDKGNDYEAVADLVAQKVRVIVAMGTDNSKILRFFQPRGVVLIDTHSLQEAVQEARQVVRPGEAVLLSPACASFDLFKNYEDRGDQFRRVVLDMTSPA